MQVMNAYKKQKFTCEIPTIGICNGNDSNEILWVVTVIPPQKKSRPEIQMIVGEGERISRER